MEKKDFILGVDYYLENGYVIFTAKYLSEKPTGCCGNGCRHCPYEPKNIKGGKTIASKEKSS
jgi:hypothetical protein